MNKFYLLLLFFLFKIEIKASDGSDSLTVLRKAGGNVYACSPKTIFRVIHNKPLFFHRNPKAIIDILPLENSLVYCTSNEVILLKPGGEKHIIKFNIFKPNFVSLCRGIDKKVYVASQMNGVYEIKNDSLILTYSCFPINSIASTSDSSIWEASNIGLHKIRNGRITLFKEEGTGNYEIADNSVEKLLKDNLGDLWIKMSQAISVMSSTEKNHHEHLPTIKFIGSPENDIYSVSYHSGLGYLFSTKEGVILMPIGNKEDNHKFFEIAEEKASENPHANLSVLRKAYYQGKPLFTTYHLPTSKSKITVIKEGQLVKINVSSLVFR